MSSTTRQLQCNVTTPSPSNGSPGIWPNHDPSIKSSSQDGGLREEETTECGCWCVDVLSQTSTTLSYTALQTCIIAYGFVSIQQTEQSYEFWDLEFWEGIVLKRILTENESVASRYFYRNVKIKLQSLHVINIGLLIIKHVKCPVDVFHFVFGYYSRTSSPVHPWNKLSISFRLISLVLLQ